MRVLIIEDEAPAARRLRKLLEEARPGIEVLDQLEGVESAVKWFNDHGNTKPDLIFMDIQLSDGLSFEIFDQVAVPAPVVFTTAFDEYALRAFKVNSIDYLLKPIDPADLDRALDKYEALMRNSYTELGNEPRNPLEVSEQAGQIQGVLQALNLKPKGYKTRFLVKIGDKYLSIPATQIAYFYTEDKGVYLLTHEKVRYPVDHSLDDLEKLLDPEVFYRLNRQYIVHIDAVQKLHTYFNGKLKSYLKPDPGHEVIVSREKASTFKSWLDR